jgi:hypothetical protein
MGGGIFEGLDTEKLIILMQPHRGKLASNSSQYDTVMTADEGGSTS